MRSIPCISSGGSGSFRVAQAQLSNQLGYSLCSRLITVPFELMQRNLGKNVTLDSHSGAEGVQDWTGRECSNGMKLGLCIRAHCGELFFLTGVQKGKWIIGVNWNHENWGGEMPDAAWIDAPNHPVSS